MPDSTPFPAEFVEDALRASGLAPADLAARGMSRFDVKRLLGGHARMTPEIATQLGDALGTGASLWLHLDAAVKRFSRPRHPGAAAP